VHLVNRGSAFDVTISLLKNPFRNADWRDSLLELNHNSYENLFFVFAHSLFIGRPELEGRELASDPEWEWPQRSQ